VPRAERIPAYPLKHFAANIYVFESVSCFFLFLFFCCVGLGFVLKFVAILKDLLSMFFFFFFASWSLFFDMII
jgi:hypothetical protein